MTVGWIDKRSHFFSQRMAGRQKADGFQQFARARLMSK
jgi:hypothetical protein